MPSSSRINLSKKCPTIDDEGTVILFKLREALTNDTP
jgi:hypothetical protein